jgi:hypothetical protein
MASEFAREMSDFDRGLDIPQPSVGGSHAEPRRSRADAAAGGGRRGDGHRPGGPHRARRLAVLQLQGDGQAVENFHDGKDGRPASLKGDSLINGLALTRGRSVRAGNLIRTSIRQTMEFEDSSYQTLDVVPEIRIGTNSNGIAIRELLDLLRQHVRRGHCGSR